MELAPGTIIPIGEFFTSCRFCPVEVKNCERENIMTLLELKPEYFSSTPSLNQNYEKQFGATALTTWFYYFLYILDPNPQALKNHNGPSVPLVFDLFCSSHRKFLIDPVHLIDL